MDIANHPNQEPIPVPRTRSMSAVWFVVSLVGFGFGLLPWILWLTQGKNFNWIGASVLAVWSAFPVSLGVFLFFNSLCRIQIDVNGCEIYRRKYLGPISIRKRFVADHIQLNTHIVWGKRRQRQHQVLYLYEELKPRQILLWDLECRDLQQVGRAVARVGGMKYSEK